MLLTDYRAMLESMAEPEFAKFSSKLTPGKDNIIGVRMPNVRKVAKAVLADDWRAYLETEPSCLEEEEVMAIVIGKARMTASERISYTERFMPHIDNWATNDLFCSSWSFRKNETDEVWDYFSSLMGSGDEFRMRLSVILRMDKFIDERVDDLLEDLATYDNEGYYYRMGAAWAVSVCYVKYPERTRAILESGRLCDWTQNKSIQKIRESYRVSDADKASLLSLRRRCG